MNYSIQFETNQYIFLTISSRKKTLKHRLFTIREGIALVKIGQYEYAVEPNDFFWIPANCLTSITYFPGTHVSSVDFSVRLADKFHSQVGFVTAEPLVKHAIIKLEKSDISDDYMQTLLKLIRFEVVNTSPNLLKTQLSEQFNQWNLTDNVLASRPQSSHSQINGSPLSNDINIALKIREARKCILSGQKRDAVIKRIFDISNEEFDKLCKIVLGDKI